ncbi:uncharacterized protein LOC130780711 [Actinidia eriantha]|uniref:uncharacterized protein LOC130780711 n=1 Tax=Actinidia eriantha TaxID=165200 RepID=UPI00258CF56F|nr:uncharacterized protein LOC130780711 [Actinidia eriantha]
MAVGTTNALLRDVRDELFSILVDESRDILVKEQMIVILHYVDKKGYIIEWFLGIVHVRDTTSLSLKASIESLFAKHELSMSSLRGQSYDGASNMQAFGVLEVVEKDGTLSEQKLKQLHLMKTILEISNEMSQALHKKDQDIVNAMSLVKVSKERLQKLRDKKMSLFCDKHEIIIPNMDDLFVVRGRSCRNAQETTHLHHYHVELFYTVVDIQFQELNNRFNEVSTELLLRMASFDPSSTFSSFDKRKLLRFAECYPSDFSPLQLMILDNQIETYFLDVSSND